MSAFLPLLDPDHPEREINLRGARELYQFNYTHVSPLAVLDRVPFKDEFTIGWLKKMAENVVVAISNRAEIEVHPELQVVQNSFTSFLNRLIGDVDVAIHGLKHLVTDVLRFELRIGAEPVPAKKLEDFADLFRKIALPPIAATFQNDASFARMRVAGPNPVMLQRLKARDPRLPVSDADFQVGAPGDSFDAALAEGRLYLADYSALDGAECGDFPHGKKYIEAPLALFVAHKTTRTLHPICIQCKQIPGPDNPIFTPADGPSWMIAKTIVEVADGNIHEAGTHLGKTHLFIEPFVISTYRQLAANHPIYILLDPHFLGTLAINEAAWKHLIANKGAVDKLFGASITAARGLAANSVASNLVMDALLPKTLAARGVEDANALPDYPYRDDAILYWNAIHDWVEAYLGIYYPNQEDVATDNELQSWGRELASRDGGRINGLPNGGTFHTLAEVTDVVALVIFTCSVQHAAVNFPQYDLMSYVPNIPLASYRPAPTAKNIATEEDYLAMMPPLDMAELQMELGYLLGALHYTELGDYPRHYFREPRVAPLLAAFQRRIADVNRVVLERNTSRQPYTPLIATGIPQSINV